MDALERLRVDVDHNDAEVDIDHYVACAGLDVAAGELAAATVRAGLGPWRVIDALVTVTQERARNHPHEVERAQTEVLLALMPGLMELDGATAWSALNRLLDLAYEKCGSKLLRLAYDALEIATAIDGERTVEPEFVDARVRLFARHVYELGGLEMVRLVVERLRELLAAT